MQKRAPSPEKKLVLDMLRIINRYERESSVKKLEVKRIKNPLEISFQFNKDQAKNKRTHQRIQFDGKVNLNKDQHFIIGHCINISASGIYVSCPPDEQVQINDRVHLIIKLSDDEEIFRTSAKVTRQDRYGYGLQFMTA